jgi:hypothetical protein
MEALTAASGAALAIYDMCKAMDKGMVIGPIQLELKEKRELPSAIEEANLVVAAVSSPLQAAAHGESEESAS